MQIKGVMENDMNVRASIAATAATSPPAAGDDDLWYKDAVIYQLHVKAFADSNNDGIGDFGGLIDKLDYLQDLGVNALWLMPFYPSPGRDDGYDIADYGAINPDFGTHEGFPPLRHRSASARASRHHRAGRQSHVGPASVVSPRAAQRTGFERAQLVRLERYRHEVSRAPASSSPTSRNPTGPGIRRPRPITGIVSSRTSRT